MVCLVVVLGIIVGAAASGGGGDRSSAPSTTSPPPSAPQTATEEAPPPPPPPSPPASESKKASNGDDAADLHDRAQEALNRAEICLVALQLNSMATSLQQARSVCEESKTTLATNDAHGFTDQNTTLFASADAGRSATNAGLAYLDTEAPSKLADFRSHVTDAAGYFSQGFQDLNARLSELGVAHLKR